jgi:hypothetical protein
MTSCLHPLCDPEHTITVWSGCVSRIHCVRPDNWILLSVVMAEGKRPVPSRTRKLSPPAPMVLHSLGCGRVGRRRHQTCSRRPPPSGGGLLFLSFPARSGDDRSLGSHRGAPRTPRGRPVRRRRRRCTSAPDAGGAAPWAGRGRTPRLSVGRPPAPPSGPALPPRVRADPSGSAGPDQELQPIGLLAQVARSDSSRASASSELPASSYAAAGRSRSISAVPPARRSSSGPSRPSSSRRGVRLSGGPRRRASALGPVSYYARSSGVAAITAIRQGASSQRCCAQSPRVLT